MLVINAILFAISIVIWSKCNINYRMILFYGRHFSDLNTIIKRITFFIVILMISFLWYLLLLDDPSKHGWLNKLPKEYCPAITWIAFLLFTFWPTKGMFNWKGRMYLLKTLKITLLAPCKDAHVMEYLHWFTNS